MLTRQIRFLIFASLFLFVTGNISLFTRLSEIYPLAALDTAGIIHQVINFASLLAFFALTATLFLIWLCQGRIGKWVLALYFLIAAFAAYYMDKFGVVIDVVMIHNILETNPQEMAGLISPGMIGRIAFFGLIPAFLVIKYWPTPGNMKQELKSRLKLSGVLIAATILTIAIAPANFASFVREHRITRLYENPLGPTYSALSFLGAQLKSRNTNTTLNETAPDARELADGGKKELVILVVGETARADRFSLNGYHKDTNPELEKRQVISFKDVTSCGTSTGESVPCMFSALKREHFNREKALHYKNALDVLFEHGVQILWRDNNSDSKGVATRVKYENFKSPTMNPICDTECRDIGMLSGLDKYIEARKGKDILIVLHQMGNHGPEYYRRYPKEFEHFKPVCQTGELSNCTQEEINNGYDNAVRYTDYFLSQVIDFLKKYDDTHATAMLYVSDHGESLGEHGIYLHAAPYVIAPKEQTHVPAIAWTGKNFDIPMEAISPYASYPLSHDDLFCTLLVSFEMKTNVCNSKDYILATNRNLKVAGE